MKTMKYSMIVITIVGLVNFGNRIYAQDTAPAEQPEVEYSLLTQVEAKYVCMPNNKRFDKEQIPVEVDDQMYYACCKMCKKMLLLDPEVRRAIDPVSEVVVDKATAVIGALPDGKVLYFENAENMMKYRGESATQKIVDPKSKKHIKKESM